MEELREQLINELLDINYDLYRDYEFTNRIVDEIIYNADK